MDDLVDAGWLIDRLDDVQIVDASFHLPDDGRDAAAEFREAHIPGAVRLDIGAFSDPDHDAPHMLPAPAVAAEMLAALGLDRDRPIVVYDDSRLHSAARGWFTLRYAGARDVALLDGGLAAWRAIDGPLETGEVSPTPGDWPEGDAAMRVVTKADLLAGSDAPILDARGPERFMGSSPEPREGMAAGHIPGARNLPYAALYNDDGTFKSPEALRTLFADKGVSLDSSLVATCGSGVTASAILFAAHLAGGSADHAIYDGSWAEWGADPATPKATGAA